MIIALYFLAIIGAAVLVLAVVGCYMICVDAFLDWRREPHRRSFYEGEQRVRNSITSDSWWFSESPETMELIANLGRGMDVSDAREKWRKSREETAVSETAK